MLPNNICDICKVPYGTENCNHQRHIIQKNVRAEKSSSSSK